MDERILRVSLASILVLVGISLYPLADKEVPSAPGQSAEESSEVRNSFSSDEYMEEVRKRKIAAITFSECIDSLYRSDRNAYASWKGKFKAMHPEYSSIYDAGSYCALSDGTQLVSFSYFAASDHKEKGQAIVLFDSEGEALKETQDFFCKTLGDLGTPKFDSLQDGKAGLSCVSVDAGQKAEQIYELDLDTFAYTLIRDDLSEVR
jgi:hypothetical protein